MYLMEEFLDTAKRLLVIRELFSVIRDCALYRRVELNSV
jgi:hypothetical protein